MKRDISYDDLGELVYLSQVHVVNLVIHLFILITHPKCALLIVTFLQVLKETLRIYPPAPGTSRDVAEDMVIDSIHIPGGFSVVVSHFLFNMFVSLNDNYILKTTNI